MFKQKIAIDHTAHLFQQSAVEEQGTEYTTAAATTAEIHHGVRLSELGGHHSAQARDTSPWNASIKMKHSYEHQNPMKEGRIDMSTLLAKTRHDETAGKRKPDGETEVLQNDISWDPIAEGMETADVGLKQAGKGRTSGDQSDATLNAAPLAVYDYRYRATDHGQVQNVKLKMGKSV